MRPRPYRRHVSHPLLTPSPYRPFAVSPFRRFAFPLSAPLLLAAAAFATCSPTGSDSPESRADLTVLNGAEPESIDPAEITGQLDGRVAYALVEGLLHFARFGRPQQGIARSWDISPDRLTYTFHLRPEAKWSNGDPVTANDFVASWNRALLPETASEYAYIFFPIRNAEAFNEREVKDFSAVGVKALDSQTLRVELDNPTPYFLDLCCFMTYLPVHLPTIQKYGDEWIKPGKLVNNGPFLLKEWKLNYRMRLEKNPNFWDAKNVQLQTIDLLPVENATTAY